MLKDLMAVAWQRLVPPGTNITFADAEKFVKEAYAAADKFMPNETNKKPRRGKGSRKKIGAPRGPRSAYCFFVKLERTRIAKELGPDATFGEIGKEMGKVWENLTSEEKQVYIDKSKEDKIRYNNEKARFENGEVFTYERKRPAQKPAGPAPKRRKMGGKSPRVTRSKKEADERVKLLAEAQECAEASSSESSSDEEEEEDDE